MRAIRSAASQIEVSLLGLGFVRRPRRGSRGMKSSALTDEMIPAALPGNFGVGSKTETGVSPRMNGTLVGRTNVQSSRQSIHPEWPHVPRKCWISAFFGITTAASPRSSESVPSGWSSWSSFSALTYATNCSAIDFVSSL